MRKSTPEDTLTRDSLRLAKLIDDCVVVLIKVQAVPLLVFLLPARKESLSLPSCGRSDSDFVIHEPHPSGVFQIGRTRATQKSVVETSRS